MPQNLPYLPSYKNVDKLFDRIASAKVPDTFNHSFLYDTIGLKGTADRALIPFLKTLGFLEASGKPTSSYAKLKNSATASTAIGDAMRAAYAPLFSADENAHKLTSDSVKGLISQVAGTDAEMTNRIAYTFGALAKHAKFDGGSPAPAPVGKEPEEEQEKTWQKPGIMRPDFHYNIQIHLPSNATEETYLNIFNALRKTFQ